MNILNYIDRKESFTKEHFCNKEYIHKEYFFNKEYFSMISPKKLNVSNSPKISPNKDNIEKEDNKDNNLTFFEKIKELFKIKVNSNCFIIRI